MTLANMTQEETNRVNREHCKSIAQDLELIALGQAYKCPYCDEIIDSEEYTENEAFYEALTDGDECECPHCHETEEFQQLSVYDWLDDALDIQYTVNHDLSYYAGRVMVACGGPNIYVDTFRGEVALYWWTDRAEYDLTTTARDALDETLEELYEMARA